VGESTAIAHAIFIIVATILAGMLAMVVLSKLGSLQSVISQGIQEQEYAYSVRLSIVYGYYNSTSKAYIFYVKNTGTGILGNISDIDIYLGPANGTLQYYSYSSSGGTGHWNYTELGTKDNKWEPGETVKIYVYTGESLGELVKIRIVMPWGSYFEETIDS